MSLEARPRQGKNLGKCPDDQVRVGFDDKFTVFFIKTYVVGTQNHLAKVNLMSTHNFGFYD